MGCCLFDCIGGFVLTIFRWAIFFMNLIFIVAGIALIVLGSIVLVNISTLDEFYEDQAEIAAIVLISAGCLTFLVAFLGCCGAIKRTPWMMNTYAGLLFVIFAIQLAGGIIAFVYKDSFTVEFKEKMADLMELYPAPNAGGEQAAKEAWDRLQSEYKCCGITTFRDWSINRPELGGIPDSCNCDAGSEDCRDIGELNIYGTGCYSKLEPYLNDLIDSIGGIGIGVAILELVAGIFSLCLANRFKDKKKRRGSDSS